MSLAIRRLRNVFAAARDLRRPEEVCARMESSVQRGGAEELGRVLDVLLDPADPSVWIIRRIRVSFAVRETKDGEHTWARGIAQGIRRQIELGPDGQNTLRFPDQTTYWAWFLRDLAADSSSRWWYEPLDSLKHLDFGAACLTLLSRQPELTASVLVLLEEWGVWEEVIRRVTEEQASRLLDWITPAEEIAPGYLLEAAAEAWDWACSAGRNPAKIKLSAVT